MRDEKLRRILNRLAIGGQCLFAFLRHDTQGCWKFRALDAVACQFCILQSGKGFGLVGGFEKTSFSLPRFAVIDYEFEMRTIAIRVSASPDFALCHAILLPFCCRKNK